MAAGAVGTIKYENGVLPQRSPYPPASVRELEYSGKADTGDQDIPAKPRKRSKLDDSCERLKKYISHDSMLAGTEAQ
jgi:hypothetical protein